MSEICKINFIIEFKLIIYGSVKDSTANLFYLVLLSIFLTINYKLFIPLTLNHNLYVGFLRPIFYFNFLDRPVISLHFQIKNSVY